MGLLRQTELAKPKFLLLVRTASGGHDYQYEGRGRKSSTGWVGRAERNIIDRRGLLTARALYTDIVIDRRWILGGGHSVMTGELFCYCFVLFPGKNGALCHHFTPRSLNNPVLHLWLSNNTT